MRRWGMGVGEGRRPAQRMGVGGSKVSGVWARAVSRATLDRGPAAATREGKGGEGGSFYEMQRERVVRECERVAPQTSKFPKSVKKGVCIQVVAQSAARLGWSPRNSSTSDWARRPPDRPAAHEARGTPEPRSRRLGIQRATRSESTGTVRLRMTLSLTLRLPLFRLAKSSTPQRRQDTAAPTDDGRHREGEGVRGVRGGGGAAVKQRVVFDGGFVRHTVTTQNLSPSTQAARTRARSRTNCQTHETWRENAAQNARCKDGGRWAMSGTAAPPLAVSSSAVSLGRVQVQLLR